MYVMYVWMFLYVCMLIACMHAQSLHAAWLKFAQVVTQLIQGGFPRRALQWLTQGSSFFGSSFPGSNFLVARQTQAS